MNAPDDRRDPRETPTRREATEPRRDERREPDRDDEHDGGFGDGSLT